MISSHFVRWTFSVGAILAVMLSSQASPAAEPETITNGIGMKLTLVPAGEFMMGSPQEEVGNWNDSVKQHGQGLNIDNEGPLHRVRITRPFYLGVYHVTVGQFRKFVTGAGYQTDAEKGEHQGALGMDPTTGRFEFKAEYSWRNPGFKQSDEDPVVCVSRNDAAALAKWLSRKEGKSYQLPTEAQWEYACRAGTTTRYSFGNEVAALGDYAWWSGNSDRRTHAAGGKRPNGFGLYDMQGNACQWCADWYDEHYYEESPVDDPKGPNLGAWRVARGGSFSAPPIVLRSASRLFSPSGRSCNFGFRVACER
jgi:formylglycine-generating enzyme required for sulfatase activity